MPVVCPSGQIPSADGLSCVPDPSMGTMQNSQMAQTQSQLGTMQNSGEVQTRRTSPAMTLADKAEADKAAAQVFADSFGVCPPGMTDTRDGYCQPPIIPFLTSSGAMAGGDASAATAATAATAASGSDAYGTTGATAAGTSGAYITSGAYGTSGATASAARVPQTGPCPPNTTPVPDKGCLPEKILSWAPGAILIPYLADLSVSLNSINSAIKSTTKSSNPIATAINNAAIKNSKSIDAVAKGAATAKAITDGIATLSTSMETINSSLQASQAAAASPDTSYGGGRRTRRRRGRGNRKTRR
jgi:hypothetical protein